MSYFRVDRPEVTGLTRVPEVAAAALVGIAIVVLVFGAFAQVEVEIDGTAHRVPLNTTIADLAETGLTTAPRGDVLAIADRRVVEPGGGLAPTYVLDGAPAPVDTVLVAPAVVESVRGVDVLESVETSLEPIAIPVSYQGEGSLLTLTQTGSVGQRRVGRGELSGQIVEMQVIEDAVPMVLTRERLTAEDRVVALTFDDGPWPGQTEPILDILAEYDVRATFFMLGIMVKRHPALAREVRDAGHTLGNHTYRHSILRRATKQEVRDEIDPARNALRDATGISPVWFRPPGGLLSPSVHAVCKEKGLNVVGWTVDPQDWSGKDADQLTKEVVDAVEPGAVILLHDGGGNRDATIEALPEIIRILRARGYTFVTLDEVPDLAVAR